MPSYYNVDGWYYDDIPREEENKPTKTCRYCRLHSETLSSVSGKVYCVSQARHVALDDAACREDYKDWVIKNGMPYYPEKA